MTRSPLPAIVGSLALVALASTGCAQGFQSAQELESAGRAPTHCAKSCETLNMRMSAFVLVEKDVAACVCEPIPSTPAAAPATPAAPPPAPAAPPASEPAPAPAPAAAPPAPTTGVEAPQSRSATGAAAGYVVLALRREQESRSSHSRKY